MIVSSKLGVCETRTFDDFEIGVVDLGYDALVWL